MASVKYGGGIVAMSGSIAGNTFARNRYSNYVRTRTKPVNPRSVDQEKVRTSLGNLVQRWYNTLTAVMRTAWGNYAANVSMKNRLGETMNLSGFNMYIRSNLQLLRSGGYGYRDTAPIINELAEKDPTVTCTPDFSDQQISLVFDNTLPWAGEVGGLMWVYQGSPQSPTRNFFNGPWRYMGVITGAVVPPTSPHVFNALRWPVSTGQKQWLAIRILRADGRLSETFTCVGTVVA